ncbi:CBS domain-containing protein [Zavarzinella formosa]|uniref:CBS domain-containing protein n=1 Tax=Zavarzinella formosa TaxID=360055 RepID=UPI000304C23D|nr:CBS domain-containing protein [Zavarzinella formosa]
MELARNLRNDPVMRLEPSSPRMVDRASTVAEAVALMRREHIGCVLVSENGTLAGIFTERDLMGRVLAVGKSLETPINDVMTPQPETVNPRDSVRAAVRRMKSGGHRHLPVVDDDNRPVGMVSAKRIVRYLVEHYPAAVYCQPPDPTAHPASAEGA